MTRSGTGMGSCEGHRVRNAVCVCHVFVCVCVYIYSVCVGLDCNFVFGV